MKQHKPDKKVGNKSTNKPKKIFDDVTEKDIQIALVVVTLLLAIIGWYQSCKVKESMEISNKAYISLLEVSPPGNTENYRNPIETSIKIKNTGQSPAYDVRGVVKLVLAETESKAFQINDSSFQKITTVMGANSVISMPQIFWMTNADDSKKLIAKELTLFLIGEITYKNVFDKSGFLVFCLFYDREQGKFVYCQKHNNASR